MKSKVAKITIVTLKSFRKVQELDFDEKFPAEVIKGFFTEIKVKPWKFSLLVLPPRTTKSREKKKKANFLRRVLGFSKILYIRYLSRYQTSLIQTHHFSLLVWLRGWINPNFLIFLHGKYRFPPEKNITMLLLPLFPPSEHLGFIFNDLKKKRGGRNVWMELNKWHQRFFFLKNFLFCFFSPLLFLQPRLGCCLFLITHD